MNGDDRNVVGSPFGGFTAIYRTWFSTEKREVIELLTALDEKPLRFEIRFDFTRLIQTIVRDHYLPWAKADIIWMKAYVEAVWTKKNGDAKGFSYPKEYEQYRSAIHALEWIASDYSIPNLDKWFDLIKPSFLQRDSTTEWGKISNPENVLDTVLWTERGGILESMTYAEGLARSKARKDLRPYGITHCDEKAHWRGLCTLLLWSYFKTFVKADLTKQQVLPDGVNPTFPLCWDSDLYAEVSEVHLKKFGEVLLNHKTSDPFAWVGVVDPLEWPSPSM